MSTEKLVAAIVDGDAQQIQQSFNQVMADKTLEYIDAARQVVAQNMFNNVVEEEVDYLDESCAAHELHVQPVKTESGTKYKVLAVGKNFADGIKTGEHLSDTELDDASEIGAKIVRRKG